MSGHLLRADTDAPWCGAAGLHGGFCLGGVDDSAVALAVAYLRGRFDCAACATAHPRGKDLLQAVVAELAARDAEALARLQVLVHRIPPALEVLSIPEPFRGMVEARRDLAVVQDALVVYREVCTDPARRERITRILGAMQP